MRDDDIKLQTDRLLLRRWTEADARELFCLACDDNIARWAGWLPHTDENYSKAIIRTMLSMDGEFAITLDGASGPEIIGSIGIRFGKSPSRGILRDDEAEVGYWIGKSFWNRGYATEALTEIVRYGFEEVGASAIWCGYFDGNTASEKVINKCGLLYHHRNENLFNAMRSEHYNENMAKISLEQYRKRL